LPTINPGDRIEVVATPFAVHVGKRGIVEAVQDLTRGQSGYLPMSRLTVRGDDGRDVHLIVPPDRIIKIIR
jgi:hypothetical protein